MGSYSSNMTISIRSLPVLLDCDPGIDDAFALAYLACRHDVETVGVVTTAGNVGQDDVLRNALGLTWEGYRALSAEKLESERTRIHTLFASSRPHYLIDTINELPEVIADINRRLAKGEMPQAS